MSGERSPKDREGFSLARWSQRKHEAARAAAAPAPAPAPAPSPTAAPAAPAVAVPAAAEAPLPAVESLTFESDFTAFLGSKVDEGVKRAALRRLFSDPRFNVMDGLDVYIDDYSKPDPMPEGFLDKLAKVYDSIPVEAKQDVAGEAPDAPPVIATDAPPPALASETSSPAAPEKLAETTGEEPPRADS